MFFFDNQKYTITFEVDDIRKANFDLALEKLGKTKEEAFDAFLAMLITKALGGDANEDVVLEAPDEMKRLSKDKICSRIRRWAERKYSYPHMMLAAYFEAKKMCPGDGVILPKMEGHFNQFAELSYGDGKFGAILRQMCSSAERAYGNVFVYDRRRGEVHLNEEYKDLVLSLKDKFLPPEPDYR